MKTVGRGKVERIKAVFCFDENLTAPVQAAAASLTDSCVRASCHCEIHCVCTQKAGGVEEKLRQAVVRRDPESVLFMHCIENPYADSYEVRGISAGTYLRLALPGLLPDTDKILYLDADILIRDSLLELWETPLSGMAFAAVKGAVNLSDKWEWNSRRDYWHMLEGQKGSYINAGVTLLNLSKLRRLNLKKTWDELARRKLYYQDQDILNITCKGAIRFLPPKYNRLAYMPKEEYHLFVEQGLCTEEEYVQAMEAPVIIHYAGDKPWNRYDTNLGSLWWEYVNSQPDLTCLFDEKKARRYHGPTLFDRALGKVRRILGGEK